MTALEEIDDAGLAAWVVESVAEDAESRRVADFQPDYREAIEKDRALLRERPAFTRPVAGSGQRCGRWGRDCFG